MPQGGDWPAGKALQGTCPKGESIKKRWKDFLVTCFMLQNLECIEAVTQMIGMCVLAGYGVRCTVTQTTGVYIHRQESVPASRKYDK